jgi:hypothetical protein
MVLIRFFVFSFCFLLTDSETPEVDVREPPSVNKTTTEGSTNAVNLPSLLFKKIK